MTNDQLWERQTTYTNVLVMASVSISMNVLCNNWNLLAVTSSFPAWWTHYCELRRYSVFSLSVNPTCSVKPGVSMLYTMQILAYLQQMYGSSKIRAGNSLLWRVLQHNYLSASFPKVIAVCLHSPWVFLYILCHMWIRIINISYIGKDEYIEIRVNKTIVAIIY